MAFIFRLCYKVNNTLNKRQPLYENKNTLKKLNQRGFSHHILMPVAVLVAVTAIGVKVLTQSHAATNYRFVHYATR